jgi:hypothetical protein
VGDISSREDGLAPVVSSEEPFRQEAELHRDDGHFIGMLTMSTTRRPSSESFKVSAAAADHPFKLVTTDEWFRQLFAGDRFRHHGSIGRTRHSVDYLPTAAT